MLCNEFRHKLAKAKSINWYQKKFKKIECLGFFYLNLASSFTEMGFIQQKSKKII